MNSEEVLRLCRFYTIIHLKVGDAMKKLFSIIIVFIMILCFSACKKDTSKEYTYLPKTELLTRENSSGFHREYKTVYKYDEKGNVIKKTEYTKGFLGVFNARERQYDIEYTYNENGDISQELIHIEDFCTNITDGHTSGNKTSSSSGTENDKESSSTNQNGSQTSISTPSSSLSASQSEEMEHAHVFSQKVTTNSFLKSEATCQKSNVYFFSCACGEKGTTTFSYGEKLEHTYNQKNTDMKYQKSNATTSSPAIYYYSCICGEKGSTTFTYGSVLSGWRQENKTVYCIRKVSLHTTTDDNKNYCENVWIGKPLNVISTDGIWYKVKYTNSPQGYAYIMCKYVTDDKDEATFINYDSNNIKSAVVLDGKIGVYLCNDLSEESSSQVGYITYDQSHQYSFYIEGINQKGDWVKVRYCGYDSKNRYYDGNKLYYCKRDNLWIFD